MQNTQSSTSQNPTEAEVQPQQVNSNNSRLFVIIIASVLLTATISGLSVYFWQRSANEKTISNLEQKISSLEKQVSTMKKLRTTSKPIFSPELSPTPTTEPTLKLKTYSNEKYGFSFDYPQDWVIEQKDEERTSFSNIAEGHAIDVVVWRVTGFGYCYKYSAKKEIVVGGKTAEIADGVGNNSTEICDKPEEYANRGNTFVLIPLEDKPEGLPTNQIHISYDYPLGDINLAKSNLDQIVSTFKFTN